MALHVGLNIELIVTMKILQNTFKSIYITALKCRNINYVDSAELWQKVRADKNPR
jgi:hypothetical protein